MTVHDDAWPTMGVTARVLVEARRACPRAARAARRPIDAVAGALSRFDPSSELWALNADPRPAVPASPLLRGAVRAALAAAELTGGLVDPAVLPALERSGYAASRAGERPAKLRAALRLAPARRPARPASDAGWRAVRVDDTEGLIQRPPGLRLDLGGTAKGLAADLAAALLERELRHATGWRAAIDCGGDIRAAGAALPVVVRDPFTGATAAELALHGGAVATSGIDNRLWLRADGSPAHHLIDPSRGAPAWTGLVAVTACAPTAVEAEARAKAALLSGPEGARGWLPHGGVLIHDDGRADVAGGGAPAA